MTGESGRSRSWPGSAPLLGVATAALTFAAVVVLENAGGAATRALGILLVVLAAVAALLGVLLLVRDLVVRPWLRAELRNAQGLALIDSMPPGIIMERLLRRLYGNHAANDYIARGVLGGAGDTADTGELSISSATTVHYELRTEAPGTYELTTTVDHSFDTPVNDHTLVLFATCDSKLRDQLVAACDRPLFDWVYIPDADLFLNDDSILRTADVGVRYLDGRDVEHEIPLSTCSPAYVKIENWPGYLRFFRQPIGSMPIRQPPEFISTLKIFEIDLAPMAVPRYPMRSITGLTLRSRTVQPDYGSCFWQAPFPCLVNDVTFDVDRLSSDLTSGDLEFTIQAFLPTTTFVGKDRWLPAAELGRLPVHSWALPGHGIVVLWRPAEPRDGAVIR